MVYIKQGLMFTAVGLFLATTGCAENPGAKTAHVDHYAVRTTRLGSNIPQPYTAGADDNAADNAGTTQTLNTMSRSSNTGSAMASGMIGGGGR